MEDTPPPPEESEAIRAARARIRKAFSLGGQTSQQVTAFTLAIVAQEMGDRETANRLIDEHGLTKLLGIAKTYTAGRLKERGAL
jgi:hypothetical protein